jgi:hypothetical protein
MDTPRHINPWANWQITPGSHAQHRLPAALAAPGVKLRPQSLAEAFHAAGVRLGATAVDMARNDHGASPWARLFQDDPAFLYAELLSFNAADAGFVFAEALEQDAPQACQLIAALARQLTVWKDRMKIEAPDLFVRQLEQMDREADLSARLRTFSEASVLRTLEAAEGLAQARRSVNPNDVGAMAIAM